MSDDGDGSEGPDYSFFAAPASSVAQPATTQASAGPDYSFFAVRPAAPAPSGVQWSGPETISDGDVRAAARGVGVDPDLYSALINSGEASGARAVSPKGAIGVAQLMPGTASDLGVNPYDSIENVTGGALYLKQMLDRFKGDKEKAIAAYNAGPGAVEAAGGVPDYPETKAYVQRVLAAHAAAPVQGAMSEAEAEAEYEAAHTATATDAKTAVYDSAANVGRNPDGSIAYIGKPQEVATKLPDGSTGLTVSASADPASIAAWLKAHPNDPANHIAPVAAAKSGLGQFGAGLAQGIGDVGQTVANADAAASRAVPLLGSVQTALGYNPQAGASQGLVNRLQSTNAYGDSDAFGIGRFLGQAAPTIPLLMGTDGLAGAAGGALTRAAPALAPAADFLGGTAGGNAFLRGGSLAARGAIQGGEAAGLTSGGSDQPLGYQIAQGAILGAVLNPFLGALGKGASVLGRTAETALRPLTESGRNKIADDVVRSFAADGPTALDTTEYVPGSSPTLAEATANPGLASVQRVLRTARINQFLERERSNADARNEFLDNLRGDDFTVGDAASARDAAVAPAFRAAFANAGRADASPAVAAIDRLLSTPQGQEGPVRTALEKARNRLVSTTEGLTADEQQAVSRAVSATFGENAPIITRDVMNSARKRIGSVFDQVAANTDIPQTDDLMARLGEIGHAAASEGLPDSDLKPILARIQDIGSTIGSETAKGGMTGASYQALTRTGTALERATSNPNPNIRYYAGQIKDALDQALQNAASPEDQAALRTARAQWRNMKITEDALPLANGEPLDPQKLLQAVHNANRNYHYTGGGPLGDIAEAGYSQAQPRTVLENDPAALHGVRQDLDAIVQKGGSVADQLFPVRNALDQSIERAAPGYRAAMGDYNLQSLPVREQQYLQSLNLTDMHGNTTLNRVNSALSRIEAARSVAGSNDAKAISDDTLAKLYALKSDLARQSNLSLGKAIGSDTHQNFFTQGLLHQAGAPLAALAKIVAHHKYVAPLAFGARMLYDAKNNDIVNAVTNRFLDPALGAAALTPKPVSAPGVLSKVKGAINDNLFLPAATLATDDYQRRIANDR